MDLAPRFLRNDPAAFRPGPAGSTLWAAATSADPDSSLTTRLGYGSGTGSRQVRPGTTTTDAASPPAADGPAANRGWRDESYSHPSQGTLPTRLTGPFSFTYSLALATGAVLPVTAQMTVIVYAVATSGATRELFRSTSANHTIGPTEGSFSQMFDPGVIALVPGEILQYEFYLNVIGNSNLTDTVVTLRAGAAGSGLAAPSVDAASIVATARVDLSGAVAPTAATRKGSRKRTGGQVSPRARIPGRPSDWDPPEPVDPTRPWWWRLFHRISRYLIRIIAGGFSIEGIERTQAIQFFPFNGQGSGSGPDNSIPLVARKATIVRVYVGWRSGLLNLHTPTSVSGRLYYRNTSTAPLAPALVLGRASIMRGQSNHTLNFRVPASDCHGTIDFSVSAFDPASPTYRSLAGRFIDTFQNVPRIRIHGVLVRYTGEGRSIPPPTHAQLVSTHTRPAVLYPVEGFNFTGDQEYTFSGNLNTTAGWYALLDDVVDLRSMSSSSDVWVAVVPSAVRAPGPGVEGIGTTGAACVYVDGVLTHELGHAFGRAHAPCGPVGSSDPAYPTYGSYPPASIGEFGFSNADYTIYDPAVDKDFMSYCETWVSPYTYTAIMNGTIAGSGGPGLLITGADSESPSPADLKWHRGEHLFLRFRIHDDGKFELLPSFRLDGESPDRAVAPGEGVRCELRDPQGEVVAVVPCPDGPFDVPANRGYRQFRAAVPLSRDAATLAVVAGKDEVAELVLHEATAPTVRIVSAEPSPRPSEPTQAKEWVASQYVVEWDADGDEDVRFAVRYTCDGGRSWLALAAGIESRRLAVDLRALRGGESCFFEVAGARGLSTTTARTTPFTVTRRPREGYVVPVFDGQGKAVGLAGAAYSPDYESAAVDELAWIVDDILVARGRELPLAALDPSIHRVTLTFPDGIDSWGRTTFDLNALHDRPRAALGSDKMSGENVPAER